MSQVTIPVILAYPDASFTTYLESLLQSYQFDISIQSVNTLDDYYTAVDGMEDRFIVITELFWENSDGSDIILSLGLTNPRGAFLVISNGPVADFLPRDFSAPCIKGFEDTEKIINLFTSFMEDLRGQSFGPYQIRDFAGQSKFGQIYDALQPAIKREVHLTIPYLYASEQTLADFKAQAAEQAGNSSPTIYAIYEETSVQERRVVSQEPITGPSLFQFYLNGSTFDDRLLAKIIHTTAAALKHLYQANIPHPRLKAKHITLAENGVIKIHNTALPQGNPIPTPAEEIVLLSEIVKSFIDQNVETNPRLHDLLIKMSNQAIDLETTIKLANQIDVDLAPVKLVPERAQAKKAAVAVQKARKSFLIRLIIGGSSLTAILIFIAIYVINTYFLVLPGTNFLKQYEIPTGKVLNPSTKEMVEVKGFYMDEFEVTIGQYEKFLKATALDNANKLMPPGYDRHKKDFVPYDWKNIITAVKRKKFYNGLGEKINYNTPIFNIEYADAYAYAKWCGKRLPTELEWMRAAAGDENFKLPWGNESALTKSNTGADRKKSSKSSAGGLDGFRSISNVDAHAKTDVSPFKIKGMAGNVTEWVSISPELKKLDDANLGTQKGGNHGYPVLISNQKRLNYPLTSRKVWLGFRCASDTPVQGPEL